MNTSQHDHENTSESGPQNRPIVERPDWLWEKRADGTWEYWTRESTIIREYIDSLENVRR